MRKLLALLVLVCAPAWGQVASRDFVETEDDHVEVSFTANTILTNSDDLTVCAWTTKGASGTFNTLLVSDYDAATDYYVGFYLTDTDQCGRVRLNGVNQSYCSGNTPTTDTWYFYCSAIDNTNDEQKFYVDGDLDGSGADDLTAVNMDELDRVGIGALCSNSSCTGFTTHDGLMAYVHLYDREITQAEVRQIMHCPGSVASGLIGYWPNTDSTTQYDQSVNSNDGTNSGTAASTDGPPIGGCTGSSQSIGVQ